MATESMSFRERARQLTQTMKRAPAPAESPPRPRHTAREVEVYYDKAKKNFWTRDHTSEWIELTESSLKRILKCAGHRMVVPEGSELSELETKLMDLQMQHGVHFAGAVAGYATGVHDICGNRVLVVRGARPITPAKGKCETVRAFVDSLLRHQSVYLWGWLRAGLASLRAGPDFRPGQLLAVAGPAGCGKSLLQSLVTEIFGGRVAKPYRYLTGETAFNSELFEAEHLAIEDEAASTDNRTRRHFGSQLKNLIVNTVQSHHGKGRAALSLTPFWRVSITLNDEPENMMVLPPLDESLKDKIILLRAFRVQYPYADEDLAGRRAFRQTLSAELPALLDWLRAFKLPAKLRDVRYGVAAWQNPDLVDQLADLAPETRLLNFIDTLIEEGKLVCPWEGSATQLEKLLLEHFKTLAQNLFTFSTACAVHLARLRQAHPARFEHLRAKGNVKRWRIQRGED